MKKLKKLLSIVLAVAMVMSLAVSVGADDPSITITTYATGTESYSAYKIFDLTTNGSGGYSYTIDSDDIFYSVILGLSTSANNYDETDSSTPGYFVLTKVSESGSVVTCTVTPNTDRYPTSNSANWADDEGNGVVITALVAAIKDYLEKSPNTAVTVDSFTKNGPYTDSSNNEYYTYTASNVAEGYYYITTTTGTTVMVTNAETAQVKDKNELPTVSKGVYNDSDNASDNPSNNNGSYDTTGGTASGTVGDSDAAIGDIVYYETTIYNAENQTKLVLHDTMTKGLTFNASSVSVTLYYKQSGDIDYTKDDSLVDGTDYLLKYSGSTNGDPTDATCTFEIDFAELLEDSDYASYVDAYIVVTYTATVNSDATIYEVSTESGSNTNSTYVGYGEASTTEIDKTETYVYSMNIFKYTGSVAEANALEGASFVIYRFKADGTTKEYAVITNGTITSWTETEGSASVLESTSSDVISVSGLDAEATYYIHETVTPPGYNSLSEDVKFTIAGSDSTTTQGTVTYNTSDVNKTSVFSATASTIVPIENKTGTDLPETGGIGVTIFYVVGGILILAAAGVIVISRKKTK